MFSPTKLRHVIAVDRAGSITKAANLLNITQSSVTKSVAEIEREIGCDLFDRKSRGVVTTDLLAIVSQSYANSATFQRRFRQLDIDLFEPLALACSYKSGRSVSKHMRSLIQTLMDNPLA